MDGDLGARAAEDSLFDLDDINFGFVRPADEDDWTLAYCQAELYAEYALHAYGEDALSRLLAAYAENRTTREALRHCFDVDQADFEKGYRAYLDGVIADAPPPAAASLDLAALQKQAQADPQNAGALARLAYAYLQRKSNPQARRWALAAQQVEPQEQLAAYVLARLQLSIGDTAQALALLENAVHEADPQEHALALLAGLRLQAKDYEAASRLYRLGLKKFGPNKKWLQALARVYLQAGERTALTQTLAQLAEFDYDDPLIHKKLALEALDAKDYAAAEKWANRALLIDVLDADLHAAAAQAGAAQDEFDAAVEAYELAVRLNPEQLALALCAGRRASPVRSNRRCPRDVARPVEARPRLRRGRRALGKFEVNSMTEPRSDISLADFQGLIRKMYFEKDVARGVDGTFMWLMEEVGELASALRSNDRENLHEEFADVLAWLATIANVAGIDLSEAVRRKYGSGCPGCSQLVCVCPDGEKP